MGFLEEQYVNSTADRRIMRSPGSEAISAVIPGRIERCEPGMTRVDRSGESVHCAAHSFDPLGMATIELT
jgi:hypothetical protein